MSEYIDPNQFVISRKRKKYRFAKFNNSPLCFELSEWIARPVDYLEVGAGNGVFTVEQASLRPDMTFVAIDVKGDRLQKGASLAEERGINNIFFVRARADQLEAIATPGTVCELWITFPDPYPKKHSAGRRLTAPYYLDIYRRILARGGALFLKHDNRTFFNWSLEQLVSTRWILRELSFDLHSSKLFEHYKLKTAYEQKWLDQGLLINFVRATISL